MGVDCHTTTTSTNTITISTSKTSSNRSTSMIEGVATSSDGGCFQTEHPHQRK